MKNGLKVTVNDVKDVQPTDVFQPAQGNKFVAVDVVIENTGKDTANISSLIEMTVKDGDGHKFPESITAQSAANPNGGTLDGALATGDKLAGVFGVEVPTSAAGLVFQFTPGLTGTPVTWDLAQ